MSRSIVAALVLASASLAGCRSECESCGPSPSLTFVLPESQLIVAAGTAEVAVDFEVTELMLDPGDEVVDGQGKVALALDAEPDGTSDIVSAEPPLTFELPADLPAGPHRILGQIVRGDGTPYENPESAAHRVFFIEDANPDRPQLAIVEPRPFSKHVVGEPLEVRVAVHGFEFVSIAEDCLAPEDCDPFDLAGECLSGSVECEGQPVSRTGHVKVYALADYPSCLFEMPIGCNYDYVMSMRPASGPTQDMTQSIDAQAFAEAGTITLTAALNYSNHSPYPNAQYIIYDQITIELVEP